MTENMTDLYKEEGVKPLESVGCVLVIKGKGVGMSYPMYVDGTWDEEMGVHLEDTEEEWFHNLSSEDNIIVNLVMEQLEII